MPGLTAIFLLFLFIGFASAQENKSIAVLDIQGNGISLVEARTLSDELRTNFFQMEIYNVVERGNMEAILNEQGFQQSGCTTSECVVEAGQLLGVQKMVAGSVGKIGSLYNVNLRMFDVETGRIENNVSKRYEGKIEGLLDFMGEICEELVEQNLEGQNDSIGEEKEKPPIDNTINQQEDETESVVIYDIDSRWRIEGGLLLGIGLENHTIGMTTDNKEITISGGGGYGGALILGYGLTNELDLSVGLGIQNSTLRPEVENAEGDFLRTTLFSTLKYRIPVASNGLLIFGMGSGYYSPDDLDLDMSKISGGGHNIYTYESSTGFHLTAEYEGFTSDKLSWIIGLKYYNVSYNLESAKLDGISVPISILPNEIKDEVGELDGSGFDLIVSLNLYL